MLTGKVPFTGDTPVEIAMKHLSQIPEPPSELRPEVPHDLDAVVMRALAKDPEQRYASAEEMEADLARVARGVAVSHETEEAMTQVLSGAGLASASTMVTRPRGGALPPAPPAYRPPTPYYDYDEPSNRRSVWPWLLALGLVILGALGGWLLYTKIQHQLNKNTPVAVPDVRLEVKQLAVSNVQNAGFKPQLEQATSDTVAKGSVISEDPGPGTKIGKGSTVTLIISQGKPKSTVPEVRGQQLNDALQLLYAAGLTPKPVYVFSSQPADVVVGESPAPKTVVLRSSNVRINVSRGPKPVTVPDVTGQQFANAESALKGAGFGVAKVEIQSDQPNGTVVSSDPTGGTSVPKGSKITLSVSKGPGTTTVPDVTSQTQQDATAILQGAGFKVKVIMQDVTDPGSDGIVLTQDPQGNSAGVKNETVVITVGHLTQGPPSGGGTPTTTPSQ
jgi:serine/threonine-protein kinase